VVGSSTAFSPVAPRVQRSHCHCHCHSPRGSGTPISDWRLFMEERSDASSEDVEPETSINQEASQDDAPDSDITALKKEIEQLEKDLKAKKSSLVYAQDQVEEYSKGGYARVVAEMENTRRVRLVSQEENKRLALTVSYSLVDFEQIVFSPHPVTDVVVLRI
jgi:hypothetical protein